MLARKYHVWAVKLVLTCEHGGNLIPQRHKHLFHDKTVLQSHRGFDLGSLDLFYHLKPLADASKFSETSRLLIELNRSLHHKNLFSEYTKTLSTLDKELLISDRFVQWNLRTQLLRTSYAIFTVAHRLRCHQTWFVVRRFIHFQLLSNQTHSQASKEVNLSLSSI